MRYVLAILSGASLVLLLLLTMARRELVDVRVALQQARDALAIEQVTVATQSAALARWEAAGKAQAEALAKARADEAAAALAAEALRRRVAALMQEDADRDDCQVLLATDLARVCPGHAAGIRLHAGGVSR